MAEDAWLNLPQRQSSRQADNGSSDSSSSSSSSSLPESVFLAGWAAPTLHLGALAQQDLAFWSALPAVREAFTKTLEQARSGKALGSSLEAAVTLHVSNKELSTWLEKLNAAGNDADELKYLLITSNVKLVRSAEEAAAGALASNTVDTGDELAGVVTVGVHRAEGTKCARCWMYSSQVSEAPSSCNLPACCCQYDME
jgi:isoleucyl-tRNA synthetase